MTDIQPEITSNFQLFFEHYWDVIRSEIQEKATESSAPLFLGGFKHSITLCPDGVLVLMRRGSSDSFTFQTTSQGVVELAQESFGFSADWKALRINEFVPGQPQNPNFDLDVAFYEDEYSLVDFDRIQIRYVPIAMDSGFWTPSNAKRLALKSLNIVGL